MSARDAVLVGLLLVLGGGFAEADMGKVGQEQREEGVATLSRQITGKISAVGLGHMTLIYDTNPKKGEDFELYLELAKDVQVRNASSLSHLKSGDMVAVDYEEKQKEEHRPLGDGKTEHATRILSRKVTTITFLHPTGGLVSKSAP